MKTNQDEKKEIADTRKKADDGNPKAQVSMGIRYYVGDGVKKDAKEAARFFQLAADQKNAAGQFKMALCYKDGIGVSKNKEQALAYLRLAVEQNFALAQYKFGAYYEMSENGLDIARDERKAIEYFHLAVKNNDEQAQNRLGLCYARGEGVVEDAKEAVKLFEAAANQDDQDGLVHLAMCYEEGYGVVKDIKKAEGLYAKGAKKGCKRAEALLQELRALQEEKDLKLEIKTIAPPTHIVFIFLAPQENRLNCNEKRNLRIYKERHPSTVNIFVDRDDFGVNGRLRNCRKYKYESIPGINVWKVKIDGHGCESNHFILSKPDAYPDHSSAMAYFTPKMVAHLIRKIKKPELVKPRTHCVKNEKFPENHLRISIEACHGIIMGKALFDELYNAREKPVVFCSITACKQDVVMNTIGGVAHYQHTNDYLMSNYPTHRKYLIFITLFYMACAQAINSAKNQNYPDSLWHSLSGANAVIYLILLLHVCYLEATKGYKPRDYSNSRYKVVLTPDFNHYETDHWIHCKSQTKEGYQGKLFSEDTTTTPTAIEVQPGVLLERPSFL